MIDFNEKNLNYNRLYNTRLNKILYLGRLSEDKGLFELINAFKILIGRDHNLVLDIVGNGDFMDKLKIIIENLGLERVVHIRGGIFEPELIKYYYENSDLYILPTYHEGFPRTLYEAMIFGTPIITTFVGGIPAIMKDEFNCIEINPKSVFSIVNKIEFAINNYSKMVEYAKNGLDTVKDIISSKRPSHAKQLNQILNHNIN
jgi:glycosyltransferase involved in cell wall biosynthesis